MEKKENDTVGQHGMPEHMEMDTSDPSWSDEGILQLEVVYYSIKYPESLGLRRYLLQSLPRAQQLLSTVGFTYTVDPCFITVSTPRREPDVLRRAKEFLQLLVVNMPVEFAFKLFKDRPYSCVIKIQRKELDISLEQIRERVDRFRKYRDDLEKVTSTTISMQYRTIVVIGKSSEGVKIVRDMAKDCFVSNESPAPKIRRLERDELARKLSKM